MPILQTHQLVCGYDSPLLGPLDLSIPDGQFVLIEGPNGIGKSTLVQTLAGLLPALSGDYEWAVDRSRRRFVPQVRTLDPVLPATVADVVATGALHGDGLAGLRASSDRETVERALERVDMTERADALFRDLSEGQKQLVLLARATLEPPRALLLDEPTASMDPQREARAVELLERQRDGHGTTVLVIAHGSRRAREAADARLTIDAHRDVHFEPSFQSHSDAESPVRSPRT